MARKIKIDNAVLKRRKYKSGKKQKGILKIREFLLIVCEGEKTEPNYFNAIKNTLPKHTLETYAIEIKGTGDSTLKIVEKAIELRAKAKKHFSKKYDQVWVVFDRDSFSANQFDNSIFKAKANNMKLGWSNEAFELWYILHFTFRNSAMSRDDYKSVIEREINRCIREKTSKNGDFVYQKNSKTMYQLLQKYGNEEKAINWAKQLCSAYEDERFSTHNPRTEVYKLIEKLNSLKISS